MNKGKNFIFQLGLIFLLLSFAACEDFLGDKTNLDFIETPQQTYREVAYVPVQPILNQFVYPSDVIAGFDELIYVVDKGSQEVVALDESGRELARKFIPGAKAIAQDRRLNLLVIGTKKDTSNGSNRSAIYRLELNQPQGYGLRYAKITNEIVHPFYFKASAITQDVQVSFQRITVLNDNSYYVSRNGPRNNPNQATTPDDAILVFDDKDKYITPIIVKDRSGGNFRDYFKKPFAITSLAKPPQFSVDQRGDFIYTSLDPNSVLKVSYIEKQESADGIAYTPKVDWSADTSKGDHFLNEAFKFEEPSGIEYAGDGSNYIFVVDKQKDSLYQFTANGIEGVQPPPASGEVKYIRTSFGGKGQGPTNFNEPMAVAYKNKVLYVADAGNGRILRFKLTLDIQ